MIDIRHDWTVEEALKLMESPLEGLTQTAAAVHRKMGDTEVQKCKLLSIKTGACPEDCGYCSQSAHFKTPIRAEGLMEVEAVAKEAKAAKEEGAQRLCMGAAWRKVPEDKRFDTLLAMIREVAKHDLEVCCTFGMATESQVMKMKEAGLTAYNHNLDTSREFYPKVITTRDYDDRLNTLKNVRKAGVQICSGGILGLGESVKDRAAMLVELAQINPHPESVPVNLLVPTQGTPLESASPVPFEDFLRMIATARIMMPKSKVRLSAGRNGLTQKEQLECFRVGANSIFMGDKLLTAPNVEVSEDELLLEQHQKQMSSSVTSPSSALC